MTRAYTAAHGPSSACGVLADGWRATAPPVAGLGVVIGSDVGCSHRCDGSSHQLCAVREPSARIDARRRPAHGLLDQRTVITASSSLARSVIAILLLRNLPRNNSTSKECFERVRPSSQK